MAIKNRLITGANFRDFDWNKAKLFYHIVKCGSYVKAAEIAGTDQPALTRQMQGLEEQLGCPLLVRKPGFGIILTRKGEELFNLVEPFFAEIKGFCMNHHPLDKDGQRKIRIATTHALSAYVLSDFILKYNKQNPHLVFELVAEDHILDVVLNDVDIAIRPYDEDSKGLIQEPLFTLEKKLYASKKYLERYGEPQTIDDLKDHRLIATASNPKEYPYADVNWILKLGMPKGELHKPIFLSNSVENMIKAAQEGLGIVASYDEMSILKNANLVNILSDVKDTPIECYFIYPYYLKKDKDICQIKSCLKKAFNK